MIVNVLQEYTYLVRYVEIYLMSVYRQFEGKHLKSHQDLMNKGVELSGIITRLQSQLAHERQSTTASS